MTERERIAPLESLDRLTRPTSVAIVGGSADFTKIAGRPVKFLRHGKFRGDAYLVNPSLPNVEGFESVRSIGDLPEPPDAAFVALGTKGAIEAVRELAAIGTPAAIVLAAGFAEAGPDGAALQEVLAGAAGPMRLLGPNSLGMVNLTDGVLLSASDVLEIPDLIAGGIGVASQSGGVMGSLLSRAAARGVGFSKLFSTGNEADLDVADCLEYFVTDEATSTVILYLETLRHPARFLAVAAQARAAGKTVLCYKVGRSESGARAASSHTGALAGSDRVYDALFERTGVQRVARFDDLLDLSNTLANSPRLRGRRVGVLTTTGGIGTLLADACGSFGFELSAPDAALVDSVEALVPGGLDLHHNPIDLTLAGIRPEVMTPVVQAIARSECFDALVVVLGSSAVAQPRLVADPLIECVSAGAEKPIVAYASPHVPDVINRLNRNGIPSFTSPETCAAALGALRGVRFAITGHGAENPLQETIDSGTPLNEAEAKALFAKYGIRSPENFAASTPAAAGEWARGRTGRFAVKVLAAGLGHKSDVGGVRLDTAPEAVEQVAAELLQAVAAAVSGIATEGILVEEMASGTEMLLGLTRDPALGPAIMLGAGGVAAEMTDDTVIALPPLDLDEARALIGRLRIAPLLNGARGQIAADTEALANAVVAVSTMLETLGDSLVELEVNPLAVGAAGQGVLALDAVVRLAPQPNGDPAP